MDWVFVALYIAAGVVVAGIAGASEDLKGDDYMATVAFWPLIASVMISDHLSTIIRRRRKLAKAARRKIEQENEEKDRLFKEFLDR